MKIIAEWRCAYRYLTVKLALLVAMVAACEPISPVLQQYLPHGWYGWAAIVIALARLVPQPIAPDKGAALKRRSADRGNDHDE
jgi:hypothetical protein